MTPLEYFWLSYAMAFVLSVLVERLLRG